MRKAWLSTQKQINDSELKGASDAFEFCVNTILVLEEAEDELPEMPEGYQCEDCDD
jgi:hypothetical protein